MVMVMVGIGERRGLLWSVSGVRCLASVALPACPWCRPFRSRRESSLTIPVLLLLTEDFDHQRIYRTRHGRSYSIVFNISRAGVRAAMVSV